MHYTGNIRIVVVFTQYAANKEGISADFDHLFKSHQWESSINAKYVR